MRPCLPAAAVGIWRFVTLIKVSRHSEDTLPVERIMKIGAALVALMGVVHSAHGQATLDVAGKTVALGAERSAVLTDFKRYRLVCLAESTPLAECASVLVQSASVPHDAYANVFFEGGRVKSVRKYWQREFEGTNPTAFAKALFAVVSQLSRETGQVPTVTTAERRDPGVLQQSMLISAGRRSVELSYVEGARGADGKTLKPFVTLTEKAE